MTTAEPAYSYAIAPDTRRMEYLPVARLRVDPNKQREIRSTAKCQVRARAWDWAKAEAATVAPSRTDRGMYDVIEGQHRIVSLKLAIEWNLAPADLTFPCFVMSGLSDHEQAQLGVDIPRSRQPHSALEKWHQDVRSGRPHQVMAEQVFDQHGLSFVRKPSSIGLGCVATVERLISRHDATTGALHLDTVLTVLEAAYPTGTLSAVARWDRHLVQVVFGLVVTKAENLDLNRLAQRLSLMPAESWVELGRGQRGGGVVRIREELVKRYNLNLRNNRI